MNRQEKQIVSIYVVLSLSAIVILIVLLSTKKCGENYRKCFCSQKNAGRRQVCQDTNEVWRNYQNGLTEYAPMPKEREWTRVSPGDINFPPTNCPQYTSYHNWDFTGIGSA